MPSLSRSVSLAVLAALLAAGCTTTPRSPQVTGSIPTPENMTEEGWRRYSQAAAQRYDANPADASAALGYGQSLRALGQTAQAVAVLERAAIAHPLHQGILAAYGRSLADAGRFEQALEVLGRAHRPDRPDWRILNAQGAILDQLARHDEARQYYDTALKMAPGEPGILSNLGMSYLLTKDLGRAETILRQAAAYPQATPRVRQNLALALTLRGKKQEALDIAGRDLGADEARALVDGWSRKGRQAG